MVMAPAYHLVQFVQEKGIICLPEFLFLTDVDCGK